MKIEEMNKKTINELQNLLRERREDLRRLRFDLAASNLKNIQEIKKTKKDAARILTVLNRRPKVEGRKLHDVSKIKS